MSTAQQACKSTTVDLLGPAAYSAWLRATKSHCPSPPTSTPSSAWPINVCYSRGLFVDEPPPDHGTNRWELFCMTT